MTDLTGQTIGKYTLIESIGNGGMAEVYKARQQPQDRDVVVKLLHRHLLAGGEQTARMQREMRIMARLQHPNIVRILDAGMAGDQPYLVMEYLRGGTLGAYLKVRQSIPVDQALDIVAQLADALAYAHRRGVIHRDIKPGNVLFDDTGSKQVLLGDFGLACLDGEAGDRLTVAGAMLGTPVYMSPEAVRGEECDLRSDIYSLGVVLYEMVTGTPPYLANTPYSMLQKLANEPLRRPRGGQPDAAGECRAADPARRGQGARGLHRDGERTAWGHQGRPGRIKGACIRSCAEEQVGGDAASGSGCGVSPAAQLDRPVWRNDGSHCGRHGHGLAAPDALVLCRFPCRFPCQLSSFSSHAHVRL